MQTDISEREEANHAPAPPVASETEVLDIAAALARVEGDLPLLQELAQIFLEDCPQWLADMREGIRQNNARAVRLAAHTLRGSVGFFGSTGVYEVAGRLEELAGAGDLTALEPAFGTLERAVDSLLPVLKTLASPSLS